jgi:hypothetical protein
VGAPKQQRVREHDSYQKRLKAMQIVREGGKLDDVVSAGIYASRGAASLAIRTGMEQARREMFAEAELYRAQQLDRLETLLSYIWPRCTSGDEKAVAEARRIISDIGDLTGAKAPVQVEIGGSDVERFLRAIDAQLEQLLGGRAPTLEGEVVPGEDEDGATGEGEDAELPLSLPGPG